MIAHRLSKGVRTMPMYIIERNFAEQLNLTPDDSLAVAGLFDDERVDLVLRKCVTAGCLARVDALRAGGSEVEQGAVDRKKLKDVNNE